MTLRRNLLAAVLNSGWTALIALAATPFYLEYLGLEAYGLIGFFTALQAILQFLDFGIAPTINREVARCSALGHAQRARDLLRSLELVYLGMGILIAFAVIACAPLVAAYWLKPDEVQPEALVHAIAMMGLIVACRWPSGLYLGALLGKQRVVASSTISICMVTVGNVGAVLVLAFVSPTIQAFFLWQIAVGAAYTLLMRWAAWRAIERSAETRFRASELRRVWRFSAGMSAIAVCAIILTQVDKILLSNILELKQFGIYVLATTVVSGLYLVISPLFNVMYPRFSSLVAAGDTAALARLYRAATRLLAVFLFPLALLLAVLPRQLLQVWTGNSDIAAQAAPIISLLAAGTALHGVMFLPYALQLAYGETRMALTISIVLTATITPLLVFLATTWGPIGAALAWLALHVFYLFFGTWLTHRKLLPGIGMHWLAVDVGVPLLIALAAGAAGVHFIADTGFPLAGQLALGVAMAAAAALLSLWASPGLRAEVSNSLQPAKSGQVSC